MRFIIHFDFLQDPTRTLLLPKWQRNEDSLLLSLFRNSYIPPFIGNSGGYTASLKVTYFTNCQYVGLSSTYSIQLHTDDPITCGNILCGTDRKCTHFTWLGPTDGRIKGICSLRSAPETGGEWYSNFLLPSPSVCGFIPQRANPPPVTTSAPTTSTTTISTTTAQSNEPTVSCSSSKH